MAEGDQRPDEPDHPQVPTPAMVVAGRTISDARLSPNATAVVAHVNDGAGPRLVCVELGDEERVTPGPETVIAFDPSVVGSHPFGGGAWNWFPDSRSVVYVAAAGLYRTSRNGGPGQLLATPTHGSWFASPTVSSDGRRIAEYSAEQLFTVLDVPRNTISAHAKFGVWMAAQPTLAADGMSVAFSAGGRRLTVRLADGGLSVSD